MASAGWYPDPQDPQSHQYFDGQRWTGDRRPASASAPQPPQPQVPQPQTTPLPPATPQQWAPPPPPPPAQAWAPAQPQQQPPAQPWAPAVTPTPTPTPAPAPAQQLPPAWEQQPQQQPWEQPRPQQQPWAQPQPWEPQPQQPWAQPQFTPGAPQQRRHIPLIIALVVVVAAGLGVGGFFVFRGGHHAQALTFDGKVIDNPNTPLQQAATTLHALVTSRHGAQGANTRCYYGLPATPGPAAKKTDVDDAIWCGPVLFVDGDASKQWLRFPLTSATATDGNLTLTPAGEPATDDPEAVPADLTLTRPDKAVAPSGAGGLSVPAPPPAAATTLIATGVGAQAVPAAPSDAVIGSINGGIKITKLGTITRYGTGDQARSAPSGDKLIAFQLTGFTGDNGVKANLSNDAGVSINGAAARPLPNAGSGQYEVVAVPNSATSVDLVLKDGGYRQTLSLLNGKPGAHNIQVLTRSHRSTTVTQTGVVVLKFSEAVVFDNGTSGTSQTGTYSINGAKLDFTVPDVNAKASSSSKALLYIDVGYTMPQSPGHVFGFPAALMTFTPAGGSPIKAKNVATGADKIYDVFEVPASLTSGTLHIAGSVTSKFTNSADTYKTTLATPITVRISFPAG